MQLFSSFRTLRWLLQARQGGSGFPSVLQAVQIQTYFIPVYIFSNRFFLLFTGLIARQHAHRVELLSHELGQLGLELPVLGCELISGESVEAQFVGLQSLFYIG